VNKVYALPARRTDSGSLSHTGPHDFPARSAPTPTASIERRACGRAEKTPCASSICRHARRLEEDREMGRIAALPPSCRCGTAAPAVSVPSPGGATPPVRHTGHA